MTSEAIVIGVNKYQHLQPLDYAQQDAKAMAAFLKTEAKFDHVYYFAEDAEPINGVSMQPTQNNLRRILQTRVAKRGLGDGDNFWFFFSGHGMRDGERDFLMPIDGYAEDVAASGISTAQVSEWLRGCGADNVVMILDACRNGGRKDGKGIGDETREDCRQTGVISLFSCSPNQFSYELPQYQQGAFTKALLEGLGTQGACATVARLDEYLKRRVPEVVRECLGNSVNQFPYSIAEPINKAHLILMPKHSRPEDLDALKMDALRAENRGDLRLALQCWLRVNIASRGLDNEAIDEIVKLKLKLKQSTSTVDESGLIAKSIDSVRLISERSINYQPLRDLVAMGKWEEADQETLRIMLLITNRLSKGWLTAKSIREFPCKDLYTIDQLWVTASSGKFGFSVQIKVWETCNQPTSSGKGWDRFCMEVGWKNGVDQGCYSYNEYPALNKSILDSPLGELPYNHWIKATWAVWTGSGGASYLMALSQRFLECNKE